MPARLVRYGVAPDHPRIKQIIKALHRVVNRERIRFVGNVAYGTDLKLDDLRRHYDAVIFATGAMADRSLDQLPRPEICDPAAILDHLPGPVVDAAGWSRLDAHEIALGQAQGRDRVKVVPRDEMINAARGR